MSCRSLWLIPLLLFASLAPAPQAPPPAPQAPASLVNLGELRAQAATKAYELAWLYYSENRVDSEKVYRWSRRLFEAQREAAVDPAGQITAAEAHLERISRLEDKIRRIRRLGFGDSLDVLEVTYYRKEADFWLAKARSLK